MLLTIGTSRTGFPPLLLISRMSCGLCRWRRRCLSSSISSVVHWGVLWERLGPIRTHLPCCFESGLTFLLWTRVFPGFTNAQPSVFRRLHWDHSGLSP